MTIDKQALLVSKAKASVFTMGYISQFEASDIDSDDIDLRFEVDGVETGTTVSIVDECGHAAQIITALLDELEHYKSREERVTKLVMDNSTSWDALYKKLEAAEKRLAEQSAIVAAAEKLVRCKGRYHSELNYRALAKLFGVVTPDLPPLEHENVHYADAAEVEITALRQRIAELEARTVAVKQFDDFQIVHYGGSEDYAKGYIDCQNNYNKALTAAGIKVKG
ncbi:ead/Ea22-like family protein [Salmonella enterica]|nr:ead/Ea22-like family protein [Salmonella enterica]